MRGCRDCSRCTETAFTTLWKFVPRVLLFFVWRLWTGIFSHMCPVCRHRMDRHAVVRGRFMD